MAKKIYYLHSCNEWKEYSSMRLLFIGTSQQKLKMKISKEIEEGNMEYKPVTTRCAYVDGEFKLVDKENTPKEQAKLFAPRPGPPAPDIRRERSAEPDDTVGQPQPVRIPARLDRMANPELVVGCRPIHERGPPLLFR